MSAVQNSVPEKLLHVRIFKKCFLKYNYLKDRDIRLFPGANSKAKGGPREYQRAVNLSGTLFPFYALQGPIEV